MAPKMQLPPKAARKPAGKRPPLASIKDLLAAKQAAAMRSRLPQAIPNGGVTPGPASFAPGMGGGAAPSQ